MCKAFPHASTIVGMVVSRDVGGRLVTPTAAISTVGDPSTSEESDDEYTTNDEP